VPALYPVPKWPITYNATTGMYGFECRLPGRKAHHCMGVFSSMGNALAWLDPHRERTWEETRDADDARVLISRHWISRATLLPCSRFTADHSLVKVRSRSMICRFEKPVDLTIALARQRQV
jgi:hypothetical protein